MPARRRAEPRFTGDDVERLQVASLELHAQRTLEDFRHAVPRAFLRVVPADHFAMAEFVIDRVARRVRMGTCWESPEVVTPEFAETFAGTLYEHPFTRRTLRDGDTGAMMLSDFMPLPRLRCSAVYRDMLRPAGLEHVLGIISPRPRGIVTLTASRRKGAAAFNERERRLFELLAPHFMQVRQELEHAANVVVDELQPLDQYGFTRRETEICRWLARGKTNGEIGTLLRIRVRTVEKHLERIYGKLGVENRTTAALLLASSSET